MLLFDRRLDLKSEAGKRSLFLFGPRQTGKTTLLRAVFPQSPFYNLLLSDVFFRLAARPALLREDLRAKPPGSRPVIIDEIQKLPVLLDEVHSLIEEKRWPFILSGSSPRKLLRGGANLLGGRARTRLLMPLTSAEIPDFDLERALSFGTLPSIYTSDEPEEDLRAYCGSYLQEEIQAEGAVRQIERFSRFLHIAGLASGELVNFEAVASDAAVPARTIREYFQVLKDTLFGVLVEPYRKTRPRKSVATAKFYLFDVGVANTLADRSTIRRGSELFGKCLEHFVFTELRAYLEYSGDRRPLSFWRSHSGDEVDFLLGDETAIEVKASSVVTERHLRGLRRLGEEMKLKRRIVVSMDPQPRRLADVLILPATEFLARLWQGEV